VDVEAAARARWAARDLARAYLNGGARLLQLRAKTLQSGAFLELAEAMVDDARMADAAVIVNDRADIAVLARAAGVHVGQEDLVPADVRRVTGPDAAVGLSTHTDEQIGRALAEPISYFAIGPVFSTQTKTTGYEGIGVERVAEAARRGKGAGLPVVAIGGITLATAPQVIAAGAASVAVIGDLMTGDPEARVREYLAALGNLPL
jgi:thiamine-phosphate pyrophosphorylase